MPYITSDRREALDFDIESLQMSLEELGFKEGDLNYVISRLIGFYFEKQKKYFTIARITGVLVNVSQEFYRRKAENYENNAIEKNGDLPEYL